MGDQERKEHVDNLNKEFITRASLAKNRKQMRSNRLVAKHLCSMRRNNAKKWKKITLMCTS